MNFTRPLAFIDVETTGTDPATDRIVQIGVAILGVPPVKQWKATFNPERPIPPEVSAVHGITDAMVKDKPAFAVHAKVIATTLSGCDLAGYNLRMLDLPILDTELRRCGLRLDLTGVRVIDCYGIFAKLFPRRLEDAVRVFCGREMTGQHDALTDTLATVDVFFGQLAKHPELAAMDLDQLAKYSSLGDREYADLAGKLYRDADGDLVYAFGRAKGVKVKDDWGFADWMLWKASFPENTREVLQAEVKRIHGGPETDDEEDEADEDEAEDLGIASLF